MTQKIFNFLKEYSTDPDTINKLLVSTFLRLNGLIVRHNLFLLPLLIHEHDGTDFNALNNFARIVLNEKKSIRIEDLIELFEFVVSPAEKEVNGAVYTPKYIREFIVKETLSKYNKSSQDISQSKFGDIACGCGGFFVTIVSEIKTLTNKSYFEIYRDNIFGLDIQAYSIERSKILLALLAISNGEDIIEFEFNLFQGNSLNFDWKSVPAIKSIEGFDIIVGNPPYVSATKIDKESRKFLENWSVSSSGKSDLYIPFFEIGMENLNKSGVLGYITVNTFYKSLNGRAVRSYFSRNKFDLSIVDFGGEQLFRKRSTYTCICIIGKKSNPIVNYIKCASNVIDSINKEDFIKIPYNELDDFEGWQLLADQNRNIITQIENTGIPLGRKFEIRNGFATLKNDVFVFKPLVTNEEYYIFEKEGNEFIIEKGICRNAIKPNTLKLESEIEQNTEKLIFPYFVQSTVQEIFGNHKRVISIMSEDYLLSQYPLAYQYLLLHKDELQDRDKGTKEYEKWYAFGRNQALTFYGYKILFPYISSAPCFVITEDQDFLFYNGYAVLSDNLIELKILQKILMSKIFWFYIKNTSKPYSGEFFSLAKNYVKNFGVCNLTDEEKIMLLNMIDRNEIDTFLLNKYNINI
jgi:methylase of polypeptide subunit release factors